jgi:hypothetical protein
MFTQKANLNIPCLKPVVSCLILKTTQIEFLNVEDKTVYFYITTYNLKLKVSNLKFPF